MKIRIKGNSVRLRLSKPDVEALSVQGNVEEQTQFLNTVFRYRLESREQEKMGADFVDNCITVYIPQDFVKDWSTNNTVGLREAMPLDETGSLVLLVEKDFKCLDDTHEDQADKYDNPKQSC